MAEQEPPGWSSCRAKQCAPPLVMQTAPPPPTCSLVQAEIHSKKYQRFTFSGFNPSQDAPTAASMDDIDASRIEVVVREVVSTGQHKCHSPSRRSAGPSRHPQPKLAEGRKWFMAQGLKVRGGRYFMCVLCLAAATKALHLGRAHAACCCTWSRDDASCALLPSPVSVATGRCWHTGHIPLWLDQCDVQRGAQGAQTVCATCWHQHPSAILAGSLCVEAAKYKRASQRHC